LFTGIAYSYNELKQAHNCLYKAPDYGLLPLKSDVP